MTDSKCNMTSDVHNLYRTQFMCRYVSLIGPKNALQFHINFFIHLHTTVGPCAVLKRKPVVGIVGALLSSFCCLLHSYSTTIEAVGDSKTLFGGLLLLVEPA